MMQAPSAPGQQGQQAAQAKPGSGTFSWLDAFQARQEALKAQGAGQAGLLRRLPVCQSPALCIPGAVWTVKVYREGGCCLVSRVQYAKKWCSETVSLCLQRLRRAPSPSRAPQLTPR